MKESDKEWKNTKDLIFFEYSRTNSSSNNTNLYLAGVSKE